MIGERLNTGDWIITKNADCFFNLLKCLYQTIFEKVKKAEKSQNGHKWLIFDFFFGQHFILLHTLKTEWNPSFRFNPICKKDSHKKVYFMVVYQEYLNMRLHENMDLGVGLGPSSTIN